MFNTVGMVYSNIVTIDLCRLGLLLLFFVVKMAFENQLKEQSEWRGRSMGSGGCGFFVVRVDNESVDDP